MDQKQFADYCWSFYGPNQIYGDFFGHTLTRGELEAAVAVRAATTEYEGDSFDREAVREILTAARRKMVADRKKANADLDSLINICRLPD